MKSTECPECHSPGPHVAGVASGNLTCRHCHATFADPAWGDLDQRRARSFAQWADLLDELNRIIDAPYRRHDMRTEYRRRVRTRTRSRR